MLRFENYCLTGFSFAGSAMRTFLRGDWPDKEKMRLRLLQQNLNHFLSFRHKSIGFKIVDQRTFYLKDSKLKIALRVKLSKSPALNKNRLRFIKSQYFSSQKRESNWKNPVLSVPSVVFASLYGQFFNLILKTR